MHAPAQYPRPVYVGADLMVTPLAEALEVAGFDCSKPTLFTAEGILCYLPPVGPNDSSSPAHTFLQIPLTLAAEHPFPPFICCNRQQLEVRPREAEARLDCDSVTDRRGVRDE